MGNKRVAVPFSSNEVSRLEDQLPLLQREEKVWERVISLLVGSTPNGIPVGVGTLAQPPRSVPQLVNVLAGVGLRMIEDLQVDETYASLAEQVSSLPRAFDTTVASQVTALEADGILLIDDARPTSRGPVRV